VTMVNGKYSEVFDGWAYDSPYFRFEVSLTPAEPFDGVSFLVSSYISTEWFTPDYPTFHPQTIPYPYETIRDQRFEGYGEIISYSSEVYIGSTAPPPPPTARVSIADGSKTEGNKGTTALALTLSLSSPSSEPVSVQYQTIDGTATSSGSRKSPADYSAATGTVTFQPGQTSRTISVLVNGDRTKESNETFTVQLSNAVGASINDGVATATILNDD
jgi:hypothetical protein